MGFMWDRDGGLCCPYFIPVLVCYISVDQSLSVFRRIYLPILSLCPGVYLSMHLSYFPNNAFI